MLDIKFIRENSNKVKEACVNKRVDCDINQLLEIDKTRRDLIQEIDNLRAEQKQISKGEQGQIKEAKKIKEKIKTLEPRLADIEKEYIKLMYQVPNMPLESVIKGQGEEDNKVVREVGKKPEFDFQPKDYVEIAEVLDIIDTKRAAKASGTRFGYLKGEAALLELALLNLALDVTREYGFKLIIPPVMLKGKAMRGMGYLDRGADEVYYLKEDDLYLIGTSEQSIGAMHMDETLTEGQLPLRYLGFSTCFRREAGSYGKDTKGILRVHQFNKTEMFSFVNPSESEKEHILFLEIEEKLMQLLEIPYRVIDICTGDLGDPAAKKWDIEAWMPGQNQYRETHSTSNCTDWQARRMNIKYKTQGETKFVHTVNGTAFSERPIIAIIENYQQKDGSVVIPKALRKYMNNLEIIKREK